MEFQQKAEEKIIALHHKVQRLLLSKTEENQIVSELLKEGIDENYAELIIENVKDEIADKKNFRKEFLKGMYLTIAGLLLNFSSFFFSEKTGSIYFIAFWGIVASGITIILRAFILFKR